MNPWETGLAIAGLVLITFVTRGFFIYPDRSLPLPAWVREALRFAPVGALVALVAPDVFMNQGEVISTWREPKLLGALAATAWYFWRRELLGTIVVGTAVMLLLKLWLWA